MSERRTELEERERLRLPDDWHVPRSLKPTRELTPEEELAVCEDISSYVATHIRREVQRKHGGK